jgi:thiamine biosynthesis lipoprotein
VIRTEAVMGTFVSIEVDAPEAAAQLAFEWFRLVEAHCSRFDAASELRQLTDGRPIPTSPILFEAVRFALMVAEETGGAFDPTVGGRMAARGFNRHYLTRDVTSAPGSQQEGVCFRDVELDERDRTFLLRRPLTLDLGAVAKGLAVDAAAQELRAFRNFAIDAGGDLYLGGCNPRGEPWSAGIRHPHIPGELVERVRVSDGAVCTSGAYERGQHILDPRRGEAANGVASATVIAPSAMLADALATAAYVLEPEESIALMTRMGVEGLIVTAGLELLRTPDLCRA